MSAPDYGTRRAVCDSRGEPMNESDMQSQTHGDPVSVRRKASCLPTPSRLCSGRAWSWSRRPPPISTAPAARNRRRCRACARSSYASESMRLTTRLMQIASWLLLQRAVAEGEMTADQARSEKNQVRLATRAQPRHDDAAGGAPGRLRGLIGRRCGCRPASCISTSSWKAASRPLRWRTIRWAFSIACCCRRSTRWGHRRARSDRAPQDSKRKKPGLARGFVGRRAGVPAGAGLLLEAMLPNFELKRDRRPPRSSSCCGRRSRPGGSSGRCRA